MDVNSIYGHKTWSVPLKEYKGVLFHSRRETGSSTNKSTPYTLYILELHHENPDKQIQLYSSRSDSKLREVWENYCRKLNLPPLEKSDNEIVIRQFGNLD
ncbi:hypothetical protein CHISP_2998 [Chitinispirillum alkaliphilum]|nr:hypothetical protein CHISP_2998 [Chitinispirillum alkaliphilum]